MEIAKGKIRHSHRSVVLPDCCPLGPQYPPPPLAGAKWGLSTKQGIHRASTGARWRPGATEIRIRRPRLHTFSIHGAPYKNYQLFAMEGVFNDNHRVIFCNLTPRAT